MFDMFNNEESSSESNDSDYSSSSEAPRGEVFVVSIGGSLIAKAKPDAELLKRLADAISSMHSSGKKIVLVIGGGRVARSYVEALDSFNADNFSKDIVGIALTRANALLVASVIPECHKEVLTEITKAKEIIASGKIPVFGGLMPFFTTDAVAALLAEFLGGIFVNLTNVDGVYAADPNDYPDARRFEEISYSDLIGLIGSGASKPGQNIVLDLACCKILERSSIQGVVLNGNDVENFSNYMNGYSFTGTVIRDDAVPLGESDLEGALKKPKRKKAKKKTAKKKSYSSKAFSSEDVDELEL